MSAIFEEISQGQLNAAKERNLNPPDDYTDAQLRIIQGYKEEYVLGARKNPENHIASIDDGELSIVLKNIYLHEDTVNASNVFKNLVNIEIDEAAQTYAEARLEREILEDQNRGF